MRSLYPKNIVAPNQNLSQRRRLLLINPLAGAGQLDIHVAIDGYEGAAVLGLAPFEADDDFLVHQA